jgi:hypothetical protein
VGRDVLGEHVDEPFDDLDPVGHGDVAAVAVADVPLIVASRVVVMTGWSPEKITSLVLVSMSVRSLRVSCGSVTIRSVWVMSGRLSR